VDNIAAAIEPGADALLEQTMSRSVVGGPATVKAGMDAFIARNRPDELILTAQIFDHTARRRSFEIVAEVMRARAAAEPTIEAAV
jgi:alkanesulfonate monooxygenase SsuD/methylene tetrahydromethanopterin reductase-like flavin-dependent oxidoreductase (luciferase family)